MSALIPYPTGPIEVLVELGVGNATGAAVWDNAAWDFGTWGNTGTPTGDWIDITCDVSELGLSSGASAPDGVISKVEATTGSVTLRGAQWDPWGSLYPDTVLGPGVPIRISWRRPGGPAWRPVFTGYSDAWPYDPYTQMVAVPLVDATSILAGIDLAPLAPVGSGDTVNARIHRLLDAAAWPAADRDIPATATATRCVATTLEGPVWDQIGVASDSDLGIVWVTRAGKVAFRPVAQTGQWTPSPTGYRLTDGSLTPAANDVCVNNYLRRNPEVVRNLVSVAHVLAPPDGGTSTLQVARNDPSIARYHRRDYTRTDLICDSDAWCAAIAGVVLTGQAFPTQQPEGALLTIQVDTRVAELLLDAEVAQTIDLLVDREVHKCVIVGWEVRLTRTELNGALVVDDVTAFDAGRWDSAGWDIGKWGV